MAIPVGKMSALGSAVYMERGRLALVANSKREANEILRDALVRSGYVWRDRFVHLRHTPYIKRPPFNYRRQSPKRKALQSLGIDKDGNRTPNVGGSGHLYQLVRGIIQRECDGWNPWVNEGMPPMSLVKKFEATEGKTGVFTSRLGRMRAFYMRRLTEAFKNLSADGHMLPLVLTGKLKHVSSTGKVRATATSNKFSLFIPIPFPGPRAKAVSDYMTTVSPGEEQAMAAEFEKAFQFELDHAAGLPAQSRGRAPAGRAPRRVA